MGNARGVQAFLDGVIYGSPCHSLRSAPIGRCKHQPERRSRHLTIGSDPNLNLAARSRCQHYCISISGSALEERRAAATLRDHHPRTGSAATGRGNRPTTLKQRCGQAGARFPAHIRLHRCFLLPSCGKCRCQAGQCPDSKRQPVECENTSRHDRHAAPVQYTKLLRTNIV